MTDSSSDNLPPDICSTLIAWGLGHSPEQQRLQSLRDWFQSSGQSNVWPPVGQSLDEALAGRACLLQSFVQQLENGSMALPLSGHWTDWIDPLWRLWLPLAQQMDAEQRALNRPFVQGILGGQGTGKSTLSKILQLLLACLGQRAVVLSIDDLYLTYAERLALQHQDSRLLWRGPPGTHDVALGIEVLTQVERGMHAIALPQFDKSLCNGQGDRSESLVVDSPSVVLFEGWLVGVMPLPDEQLAADTFVFPSPIETAEDQQFARDCNRKLRAYEPLWSFLHSLVVLKPKDYRWSLQWRQAAEAKMMATGKTGLSEAEISAFVRYFWKSLHPELFITPLTQVTGGQTTGAQATVISAQNNDCPYIRTSLVINICHDHKIGDLYLPLDGHFKRG